MEEVNISGMKRVRGLAISYISFWIDNVQKKIVKTNVSVSLGDFFSLSFAWLLYLLFKISHYNFLQDNFSGSNIDSFQAALLYQYGVNLWGIFQLFS